MGDRDWLTEVSSAVGDGDSLVAAPAAAPAGPRPAPSPPPVDEELDLMGPGRPLEGWAEELASAFAEDDDEPEARGDVTGEPGAPGAGDGVDPVRARVDDDLRQALLRFDLLATPPAPAPAPAPADDEAVRAAVDVAVAVAAADLAASVASQTEATSERLDAAESRLQRIESLLTADLAQLGPAVLSDSVAELESRLTELDSAVTALSARLEALPVPDEEAVAALVEAARAPRAPEGPAAEELLEPIAELRAQLDRLADRVAAQARFLAAYADSSSAQATQRDDLLRAILARLDGARG